MARLDRPAWADALGAAARAAARTVARAGAAAPWRRELEGAVPGLGALRVARL